MDKKDITTPQFQLTIAFGYSERFFRDGLYNTLECIEVKKPKINAANLRSNFQRRMSRSANIKSG